MAATVEGSRPLLVELQALVQASSLPTPRRVAVGLDGGRLGLLVAVLQRFGGISFAGADLFVNVVGGLSLREPAIDLAVAAALLSAVSGRALEADAAFFGEVGLLGEVRPVSRSEARVREIASHGFARIYVPEGTEVTLAEGVDVVALRDLGDLARQVMGSSRA